MSIMRDTSLNLQTREVLRQSGIKEEYSKLKLEMETLISELLAGVNDEEVLPFAL